MIPTKNDKFNLYSDDSFTRKRFTTLKKQNSKDQKIINIKRLFDKITTEQISGIYEKNN